MPRRFISGVLLALALAPASAFSQPYRVIDLGVLPGQVSSTPSGINTALQVVGLSGDQAFVWDPVNGMRSLGITMTTPPRINNNGIIVGVRGAGDQTEVVAIAGGAEYVLPSPPNDTIREVRVITDNNLLLLHGTRSWAFAAGQFIDLTTAFGGTARALNEQGMVGGGNASGPYLRLSDGRVVQPWPGTESVQLIGPAGHFTGLGFYGDPAGNVTATPLVFRAMTTFPRLYGINRAGVVVGNHFRFFEFSPFVSRGSEVVYLWDNSGCDCNVMSARAINDGGYIAGVAQFTGGAMRAVLLVPIVPAPPTGWAFNVTGTTVILRWEPSFGALEYILEAGRLPGTSDLFNGSVGTARSLTVTVPPGRYYVRLRARNAVGVSAPTDDIVIDVP